MSHMASNPSTVDGVSLEKAPADVMSSYTHSHTSSKLTSDKDAIKASSTLPSRYTSGDSATLTEKPLSGSSRIDQASHKVQTALLPSSNSSAKGHNTLNINRINTQGVNALSYSARRSILAKALMLVSQFSSVVNQIEVTCDVMEGLKRQEFTGCVSDLKSDFINLITIQRKVFEMCDYACHMRVHKLPQSSYNQLHLNRSSTLLNLQVQDNALASEEGKDKLSDLERELHRFQAIFQDEVFVGPGPDAGQKLGKRLLHKYELKEKISNFKVLLSRAMQDQLLLREELIAINTYFFGLNNKGHLHLDPVPNNTNAEEATPTPSCVTQNTASLNQNKLQAGLSNNKIALNIRNTSPNVTDHTSVSKSSKETKGARGVARHTKSSPSIVEQHTRKLNAAKMKTFGRGSLGTVQDCAQTGLNTGELLMKWSGTGAKLLPGVKLFSNSMSWYTRRKKSNSQTSGLSNSSARCGDRVKPAQTPPEFPRCDPQTNKQMPPVSHGNPTATDTSTPNLHTSLIEDTTISIPNKPQTNKSVGAAMGVEKALHARDRRNKPPVLQSAPPTKPKSQPIKINTT